MTEGLKAGIYEQIINRAIDRGIKSLEREGSFHVEKEPIGAEEANIFLSRYMAEVMERGLRQIGELKQEKMQSDTKKDESSLDTQINACNRLIEALAELSSNNDILEYKINEEGKQLLAILDKRNIPETIHHGRQRTLRPETSLSVSSLFTGATLEPSMVNELKKEILTCDRLDMLVSFIKWSGLRLIMDELKVFTQSRQLRIITTSYMGATDADAIVELSKLPNTQIRVSYETRTTRLHAKSYMFYRDTGFSTTYIGSSNLSSAAIGSGLEWNVKVTEKDMPHIIRNVHATFETYWNDKDFSPFISENEDDLRRALNMEKATGTDDQQYFFKVEPHFFQKEILERLQSEREVHGRYRNLIVAATGTGKTVISAFDYKRFCRDNHGQPNRLLFVAHRKEILEQSLRCFRGILRDSNFGDCFYGSLKPDQFEHLFISIQTFNSKDFQNFTSPEYYDYIIVDEFHHAAADSYRDLLDYYRPKILLGLTATPERMDGQSIQELYFDNIFAAEIRLPEAINRQLLVPFQYFGITDSDKSKLNDVKFERGRYDAAALENVYTSDDYRIDVIIRAIKRYIVNLKGVIGLGFCVGVGHANHMAKKFIERGIPSLALTGDSDPEVRSSAQRKLVSGEIKFIFTVDIFNEGVDIPEVNTVLFLRPTESLTVFLQQLGRGLRISEGKDVLTVLDFIGQYHQQYNFESKFRALMGHTRHSVKEEIMNGFSALPKGCFIQLERVAQQYILENISTAIFSRRGILNRIRSYYSTNGEIPTLSQFIKSNDPITPEEIYKTGSTFTSLCVEAGIKKTSLSIKDNLVARAFRRLCITDSREWISVLKENILIVLSGEKIDYNTININQRYMLNMLYYTIWSKLPNKYGFESIGEALNIFFGNRHLMMELSDLLQVRFANIHFIDRKVDLGYECPLDLHCTYSKGQILAAFGYYDENSMPGLMAGVLYLKKQKTDLFFINLIKSEKDFSPTTMYEDYAISENLFHWQSQSTTSADSETGQRYIHHYKNGGKVLLFVRKYKDINGVTQPYTYLGKAKYVRHEGSRPMSIVWELEEPIPPTLLQ